MNPQLLDSREINGFACFAGILTGGYMEGIPDLKGWTRSKQEQRRGYQLWPTCSNTSGTK